MLQLFLSLSDAEVAGFRLHTLGGSDSHRKSVWGQDCKGRIDALQYLYYE